MTTLSVHAFQVPKAGSTPAECEDAYACNAGAGLFAVADGATDAAFQALWARVLTNGFVRQPPESWSEEGVALWLHEWLPAMQDEWHAAIDWPALPWHGLNKATQTGGLATFLGLYLPGGGAGEDRLWHALAVGDCNLLRVDAAGRIVDCAPWCSAADFTSQPTALSSIQRTPAAVAATLWRLHLMTGELAEGDRLLLATDSLAACLLGGGAEGNGSGDSPLRSLLALLDGRAARPPNTEHWSLNTEHWFTAWVDAQRRTRRMKNDDVTLLVLAEAGPALPARQRVEERRGRAPSRRAGTTSPARGRRTRKRPPKMR
jgi:hypothetical protein